VGADNTGLWSAKLLPYYALKWADPAYHYPAYKGAIRGIIVKKGGWLNPLGSYAYNAKGVSGIWLPTNNLNLGLGGRLGLSSHPGQRLAAATSENQVVAPSEMFAIGESKWKTMADTPGGKDFMQCGFLAVNRGVVSFDPARHGKNYNQLFCDGHVAAMSPWVLFNQTNTAAMWNFDHQPHRESWSSQ